MITLPNKEVPYICQDLLKIFLEALFVDFKDTRLISLIDETTVSKRVDIVRSMDHYDGLIEALDVFGEVDVIKLLKPKIELITDELSLGRDFKESLNDNLRELI